MQKMPDFRRYDEEFACLQVTQIPDLMQLELARKLADRALTVVDVHGILRDGQASQGGRSHYEILDGLVVERYFPELTGWCHAVRWLAQQIVGAEVILSPYPRSAINVSIYRRVDSSQGWHYDTNPVSALLYLTDGGQPTEFAMNDSLFRLYPRTGSLALFRGRHLLHRVPPGPQLRITCPINLYHPNDTNRPDWVDRLVYENIDFRKQ